MKKLLAILGSIGLLFFFQSCTSDDSKSKITATDSLTETKMEPPEMVCATGDSSTIEYWQIDTTVANAMIDNVGGSGKPSKTKYKRGHIDDKIKIKYGNGYVGLISARYRSEDVERYRLKRCITATDSAAMVAQYFTHIIKVKVRKTLPAGSKESAWNYLYFDIETICPPPYDCLSTK